MKYDRHATIEADIMHTSKVTSNTGVGGKTATIDTA